MPTDPKLEQYLAKLDKSLSAISVGDRSDIITEIKGHILESVERNPDQNLNQVLAALGPAEEVANRYLLERGLKPGRPSKSPMVKWLTIGFLGTIGSFLLFILVLVWKFSPIIKVDEENERVQILGGLIDIDGNSGTIDLGDLKEISGQNYSGDIDVTKASIKELKLTFMNGKFEVYGAKDMTLKWECKSPVPSTGQDFVAEVAGGILLNANDVKNLKCRLTIPKGVKVSLDGTNGKVRFVAPNFPIEAKITNGNVQFESDPALKYKFEAKVTNGKVEGIRSSTDPDAIPVLFSMTNGKIDAN